MAIWLPSCERVQSDPPDFPADPFLDQASYQIALDQLTPQEWSVVAFHREEPDPNDPSRAGIVLAVSQHLSENEMLFLYHFVAGRNDAAFSVSGAEGDPQPVVIDAFEPKKFEWKTREGGIGPLGGMWTPHSKRIGNRYPIYGSLEDLTAHGRFGNYQVHVQYSDDDQDWVFEVTGLEE